MTIHLIEIDTLIEATGTLETLRFGSRAYTTRPDDVPARATFRSRLNDPGNFERHLFSSGRTFGESEIGFGEVVLNNTDGRLDWMLERAYDGRQLRIYSLERETDRWSTRKTVLIATMEQASLNGSKVALRLRDGLEQWREPIQTERFKGTTISGDRTDAEGAADLKDVFVPELWGAARNITPIVVDRWRLIYRVARRLSGVSMVRDLGVILTATQDYPTLEALRGAVLQDGQYATCLALGLVRVKAQPATLTIDAFEGATLADRSVARIVARMLPAGAVMDMASVQALHDAAPYEAGFWTGTNETTRLATATALLGSIGGFLLADRFGAFLVGRLTLPDGAPETEIRRSRIIDRGEGFARQPTADPGDGVPIFSVTMRWGRNYTILTEKDLKDVNTNDDFRSFATQEWRQELVEDPVVKERHPKAPPLTFTSHLLNKDDAKAEATRLLAIYSTRRDLFRVVVPSATVADVDPNEVVRLKIDRYGMGNGRLFRVLGVTPVFEKNLTTLELWA